MRVSFNRSALAEALGLVVSVVPSRTPKPILKCVRITASGKEVQDLRDRPRGGPEPPDLRSGGQAARARRLSRRIACRRSSARAPKMSWCSMWRAPRARFAARIAGSRSMARTRSNTRPFARWPRARRTCSSVLSSCSWASSSRCSPPPRRAAATPSTASSGRSRARRCMFVATDGRRLGTLPRGPRKSHPPRRWPTARSSCRPRPWPCSKRSARTTKRASRSS